MALLGSGGMGHVYQAHDQKLDRDVALKVLPADSLANEAARRRFQQEARILSRLSHPHVATLFDFDRREGIDFLVMELVGGRSLLERMMGAPASEREALDIGCQLARGLMAAHAAGVAHRDIKPSNLMLTRDGSLKILDFGVASLAGARHSPDATTQSDASGFVGSPAYMAPEQLLGEGDERSDLYGAGMVLYQLVCGRRPYGGATAVALTNAILHTPPEPPRRHAPALSHGLENVILKLLDKDRELRYQSARELLVDLERLRQGTQAGAARLAAPARGVSRTRPWLAAAAAVSLAALAWAALSPRARPGARPEPSASAVASMIPLTSTQDLERYPALSPDGERLAFVWDRPSGSGLYVQDVGSHAAQVSASSGAPVCCPTWAPDARSLAFVRLAAGGAAIVRVAAGGGPERRLHGIAAWFGTKLSFSADGSELVYSDRTAASGPFAIHALSLATHALRRLTEPSPSAVGDGFPAFSPDGRSIAFVRISGSGDALTQASILVVPAAGGAPRVLAADAGLVADVEWSPDGESVVFWGLKTSPKRLLSVALHGGSEPAPFWSVNAKPAEGCAESVTQVSHVSRFSIARRRNRAALTWGGCDSDIWEAPIGGDPDGRAPRRLIASTQADDGPQVSPDGRRVAFASTRSGQPQIWTCARSGADCSPLTASSFHDGTPRWSPDGRRLAFDARPSGNGDVFVIDVETRETRRLTTSAAEDVVPSWSRDGRYVYFASLRTGRWQVFRADAGGGAAELQLTSDGGFAAFEDAAGERVYFTRFDAPGLWRIPRGGGREERIADEPRCWGHWAVGPDSLFLVRSPTSQASYLERLDPLTRQLTRLQRLPANPPCGESALAISPDGRYALYSATKVVSDLFLIDAGG